jgi:hypothetical protein
MDYTKEITGTVISGKRCILDPILFETSNHSDWEAAYDFIFDPKYKKGTRGYTKTVTGVSVADKEPPIYLIPRERGGPSYKDVKLEGCDSNDLQYCLISKGFPMQDLSSFSLGPIVGEGLCLVNAAFSKSICIMHIEGGGKVNYRRKNFWQRSRKPDRVIEYISDRKMSVDNVVVDTFEWLEKNESLWFPEWDKWRKSIALCSTGDFHWADETDTVAYRKGSKYLTFVEWKKECYIKPSYDLMPTFKVYKFLEELHKEHRVPIGLVHPMAITGQTEKPITRDYIRNLFDSNHEMCCQPFVVAGKLLGVSV